jgi:hypothetical protein
MEANEVIETPKFSTPDIRLVEDGGVVSLTLRLANFFSQGISWYSFLLQAISTPRPWCGWKDWSIAESSGLIGNRTSDLPSCSIVPQRVATYRILLY